MSKSHRLDCWTASVISNRFVAHRLVLNKDEFTIAPATIPAMCRFPAPNDTLGVNTYRGNSFVRGKFNIIPYSSTPFERVRGEEMVRMRWVTEGGAEFHGLEDYNEFWCISLKDPNDGLYLQANYPLAPGESITIDQRDLDRNIFVLEGTVEVSGRELSLFSHARLSKPQEYVITNNSNKDAYILYFFQVTPDEFIAAGDPSCPLEHYRLIPVLNDSYWKEN